MDELTKPSDNYRIEISGWGLDTSFFVESTDLLWDRGRDKKVLSRHAVSEGAIVFIRLLLPEPGGNTLPMAYQVAEVQPMDSNGWCEMHLKQLHPRTKVSNRGQSASNLLKGSREPDTCEAKESSVQMETEEVTQ